MFQQKANPLGIKTLMKIMHLNRFCASLAAAAALLGASTDSQATFITTSWTNSFNSSSGSQQSSTSWNYWYDVWQNGYGSNYGWGPITLDLTMNCTNLPGPTSAQGTGGALKFISPWPGVPQNTGKGGQNQIYGTFDGSGQYATGVNIDATKYDSLTFDLFVDPASPTNQAGHICVLSVGFFLNNYSVYTITNVPIATNNFGKWMRYTCPINKATAPSGTGNLATGPAFNINCYGGENASLFTNTVPTTMWIDNLYVKLSNVPTPPPTMSTFITEPKAGLNLFSAPPTTDNFQRNSVKSTTTTGVTWLGQSDFTYSFTITNFPSGAAYPGYQAHIFVTTGPGNNSALDYNETNLIWLNVQQNSNGTGVAYFRYKINEPGANTNMFGPEYIGVASAGTLTNLPAPTVLGTWSMTFNQDTNVTLSGPGGASVNFSMRPEAVANFIEPLNVVFGAQPNNAANVGQVVVLASATVTNGGASSAPISDDFMTDAPLNTGLWTILSGEPNTVFVFPLDPGSRLVRWNQPDAGFGLQVTTNLMNKSSWVTLMGPEAAGPPLATFSANGQRVALVPSADLGPNQNFFRLLDESFAKIQVLLPGESAAPGTPSGKTGTPDVQHVGVPFSVSVNAVDRNWVIIPTSDTVHLATTDGTATVDPDVAFFNGMALMSVTFNATNTFTITASDVTDITKTSGTSSSVTSAP
jgi:hypothetical protein